MNTKIKGDHRKVHAEMRIHAEMHQKNRFLPICGLPRVARGVDTDAAFDGFLSLLRETYPISDIAAAAFCSAFGDGVYRFEQGQALVKPGEELEVMLLVLQGSVAVSVPQPATCTPHPHDESARPLDLR